MPVSEQAIDDNTCCLMQKIMGVSGMFVVLNILLDKTSLVVLCLHFILMFSLIQYNFRSCTTSSYMHLYI